MPALNFPSTPAINDTFSASGITYTWDGQRWLAGISSGATGATGLTGAPGSPGPAATQGATGESGATGATGVPGSPGSAGSEGATGATGPNGANGATGATGIVGGVTYAVTNSGASSYTIAGATNPTLTLIKGFTYYFNVAATGHPFWIKTAQVTGTGSAYTDGVTNNGVESGIVTFTVPFTAPATLYYICQFHGSMTGTITIADTAVGATGLTGPSGATGVTGATGPAGAGASINRSMLYTYNLLFGG